MITLIPSMIYIGIPVTCVLYVKYLNEHIAMLYGAKKKKSSWINLLTGTNTHLLMCLYVMVEIVHVPNSHNNSIVHDVKVKWKCNPTNIINMFDGKVFCTASGLKFNFISIKIKLKIQFLCLTSYRLSAGQRPLAACCRIGQLSSGEVLSWALAPPGLCLTEQRRDWVRGAVNAALSCVLSVLASCGTQKPKYHGVLRAFR